MRGRHQAPRRGPRVGWRSYVVVAASLSLLAGVTLLGATPSTATDAPSSQTKSGSGRFSDLKVSVSQTTNLINQVVRVSWSGGKLTLPAGTRFGLNYVQVMQCWGDEGQDVGPIRDHCQYGGKFTTDTRGGFFTASRQVNYGAGLVDPKEQIKQAPGSLDNAYVPFTAVSGKTVFGNDNEFFDANSSNEEGFGRTRPDGTGEVFFELQTFREAPGLGCGAPITQPNGTSKPRNCWLVVVPRDDKEVDGSTRAASGSNSMQSSPLSQSNWDNRIFFSMQFAKAADVCPIGAKERATYGTETITEAITNWQPQLCADNGPVYGFSQVADSVAARQLSSDKPGMAFLTGVVDVPDLVYAPVAVTGVTIGFNIERRSPDDAPSSVKERDGARLSDLKLTPRLVAKLLTQSYAGGADTQASYLKKAPYSVTEDPEFGALNPDFKNDKLAGPVEIMVPAGTSDAAALLWAWIASDAEARGFIAGDPDPYGMKVNPYFQGMKLSTDEFPKLDGYCRQFADRPALCTLDVHPYAADLHEVARAVSRGDTLARTTWDPFATPPVWRKTPPLGSGFRTLVGFTESPAAERYQLVAASLRNASGAFVKPENPNLQAGLAAMAPTASGVLTAPVAAPGAAVYPLTQVTYAVTAPKKLGVDEAKDYANLIRYAVGDGQKPGLEVGQLPPGYLPLNAPVRAQAAAVANLVQRRTTGVTVIVPTPKPTKQSTPQPQPDQTTTTSGGTDPQPVPSTAEPTPTPSATPSASPSPSTSSPSIVPVAIATPAIPVGPMRYTLGLALVLGALAAFAAVGVPWLAQRLGR